MNRSNMDRAERENYHCAIVITALVAFVCGLWVAAVTIDRMSQKDSEQQAVSSKIPDCSSLFTANC